MIFDYSEHTQHMINRVRRFMDEYIYPNEQLYEEQLRSTGELWYEPPILEELKAEAKKQNLWNLFLPESDGGAGLTNLEYAPLAEEMGKVLWASEVFNCSAPDTGNMEVLERYGTDEQKERWLKPLLAGEIRSAFLMTEPDVASSDARNISTSIVRDGDEYIINGRKWWSSGVYNPRCNIWIVMGKTDPDAPTYTQQSMILVEPDTSGVEFVRHLPVMGYDDSPHGHGEIAFDNVRVPAANMLLGEGRGFEIAQGRLGPGRIHHCMRTIGVAERVLGMMCQRLTERKAFGQVLSDMTLWQQRVGEARIKINQARLLTLDAAHKMDTIGNKAARAEIAMIKVAAPRMACEIIDMAIQAFGGAGIAPDFNLPYYYAQIRTLRLADGPDEVHNRTIARLEFKKHM
ncbi:MAG: acyl-CoA dehydrogenase family protein [Anaerolineae bacterium]|nr:acyl-CoA dehydrogenase family protein [Anaerolineae bacterium]MDQ7035110.1 acyl-CoA dehydrogenase family protein [Anaerolineae bacterium]